MNSLLNIFCYIILNVSIRKNLHMVQLMTNSYPDRQDHSRSNIYKGHDMLCPINLGQASQDYKKLSIAYIKWVSNYFPINLGQSSQDSENLSRMPKQLGACIQVDLKLFLINMGHCLGP